jgi:hypothetical protein
VWYDFYNLHVLNYFLCKCSGFHNCCSSSDCIPFLSAPCSDYMFQCFGGTYCLHLLSDWIYSCGCWSDMREENVSIIEGNPMSPTHFLCITVAFAWSYSVTQKLEAVHSFEASEDLTTARCRNLRYPSFEIIFCYILIWRRCTVSTVWNILTHSQPGSGYSVCSLVFFYIKYKLIVSEM